jgi:hypothetical protein
VTPVLDKCQTEYFGVDKNQKNLISGTSTKITVHTDRLCTEAIQCAPRPLESVDDIESSDSFPLRVFSVSDGITNDLEKDEKGYSKSKNK